MAEPTLRAPILVLAPHPDDESLGCGALLAGLWARGEAAHVLCLTDGGASHPGSRDWPPDRLAALRRQEFRAAIAALGGDPQRDATWLGYPDAALHRVHGPGQDLARAIVRVARAVGARTLLATSARDPHCDHEATAQAAIAAMRHLPGVRLAWYSVWARWLAEGARPGQTHAAPGATVRAKAAAIAAHRSQSGEVVRDAPDGFAMPEGFAAFFAQQPERFEDAAG